VTLVRDAELSRQTAQAILIGLLLLVSYIVLRLDRYRVESHSE